MAIRFILPFADVGNGISPSDGATLDFFETGTSTRKDTFSNEAATIANANPVIANGDGVFDDTDIFLPDGGRYKVVLKNKNGVQIWEADPVVGGVSPSEISRTFDTVAAMVASTELVIGDIVETAGYTAKGDGGDNRYEVVAAATGTADGGSFINLSTHQAKGLFPKDIITSDQFGAIGDLAADDGAEIQATIDYADSTKVTPSGKVVIHLGTAKGYLFATGWVIPSRLDVFCNGSLLRYSGTGAAVTIGTSDSSLSPFSGLINFQMHLVDKASTGVRLRATKAATVIGDIESLATPFDSTRTNIGVDIDGVNVSSFFNYIRVNCNHTHESFRIGSTGSVRPTDTLFDNCTAFGDVATDATSIGYSFTGTAGGQGTQIVGGNIEACGTGVLVNDFAGAVAMLGIRFEPGGNTTDIRFAGNSSAISSVLGCNGHTTVTVDTPATSRVMLFDDEGKLGIPTQGQSYKDRMTLDAGAGGNFNVLTPETDTGTGRVRYQAGAGSANFGASLTLYANAHATKAGDASIGLSQGAGGRFAVNNNGTDTGTDIFAVDESATARDTKLLIFDVDNNTLERVTVGVADSGGVGFKLLRIPN